MALDATVQTTIDATESQTDKAAIHATNYTTDLGCAKKGKFCFIFTDSVLPKCIRDVT